MAWETIMDAIIIGALVGIIYSLRRIFLLERMIKNMESNIQKLLIKRRK